MLAAQSSLLEGIGDDDLEPISSSSQQGSTENLTVKPSVARRRANLQEIENLYFTVSWLSNQNITLFGKVLMIYS